MVNLLRGTPLTKILWYLSKTLQKFKYTTVECRNPNKMKFGFQTFGFWTFGLFGLLDHSVWALMYRSQQKLFGLDNLFGFQTQFFVQNPNQIVWISDVVRNPNFLQPNDYWLSKIQTFEIRTFYSRMIIDCPKSELVQISAFHCTQLLFFLHLQNFRIILLLNLKSSVNPLVISLTCIREL